MTDRFDPLIRQLSAGLPPVRRLRPPGVRALGWLALAGLLGAALAAGADLPAVRARLGAAPDLWLSTAAAAATAVLAAWAAFQLSLPDRGGAWAWLPLPAALVWLGASGLGCLRASGVPGVEPATMPEGMGCLGFIVAVSLPLSAALIWMLRRAHPLRPGRAAAMGGLAAASASAVLLTLFHPHDASAVDLAAHAGAVGLVVLANRALGGRVLARVA